MTKITRAVALLCALASVACASSIVLSGSGSSSVYSAMPVVAMVSAPSVPGALSPAMATSSSTVGASYSSALSGISPYTFGPGSTVGVNLSSATPFTFSGYASALPAGQTLRGATLNLNFVIGNLVGGILGPSSLSLPPLNGTFVNLTVRIASGSVFRTVSGTSLNAYDLFANGFGSDLLAGNALTLTFQGLDRVTIAGGVPGSTVLLGETRSLSATAAQNYLTLYYATPTANMALAPLATPEPGSGALVVLGVVLLTIYLRFRKRTINAG